MSSIGKAIYIVGAKRTPFGAYGGKLLNKSVTELGVLAAQAALKQAKLAPELVQSCVYGNVVHSQRDTAYLSRHVALKSGMKESTPCLTVNRLCGSSFQSIVNATHDILIDNYDITLAGGAENMSESPFAVWNTRFGSKLGVPNEFVDVLWAALTDSHIKTPMAITAEALAEQYKISREECDVYALRSQQTYAKGKDNGVFDAEISAVELPGKKKGTVDLFDTDEHPRPATTIENLQKLPSIFKKNGTVTAGNASGVCDGGAAVVLATETAVKEHNLTPLARLSGYGISGCDPRIMGIGPVPAIHKLLSAKHLTIDDIDQWEVNEAFAAQTLAVQKELNLPLEKLNVNGGAIALGHPVGVSGARIIGHLAHQFGQNSSLKKVVGSACIGGGQGIALLLERV